MDGSFHFYDATYYMAIAAIIISCLLLLFLGMCESVSSNLFDTLFEKKMYTNLLEGSEVHVTLDCYEEPEEKNQYNLNNSLRYKRIYTFR